MKAVENSNFSETHLNLIYSINSREGYLCRYGYLCYAHKAAN